MNILFIQIILIVRCRTKCKPLTNGLKSDATLGLGFLNQWHLNQKQASWFNVTVGSWYHVYMPAAELV